MSEACKYVAGSEPVDGAWVGMMRAHRALHRRFETAMVDRHGLSLSSLELLGRLAEEPRRLSALASDIGLSLSRVSRIVDGLERRELVRRRPSCEDARAIDAVLTESGLALLHEAQAAHRADVQEAFTDQLSDGELETLSSAFEKLTA